MPLGEDKASYRVHVQQNPTTPMTSQQLCGSALALFWAALQRQHESHRNDSEERIFEAGQDALMQDTELPGVCLRWMRQAVALINIADSFLEFVLLCVCLDVHGKFVFISL